MGVDGLYSFIKEKNKDFTAIEKVNYKDYAGWKIAIDVNQLLNNFVLFIKDKNGRPLMTKSGKITSHLFGLFDNTVKLLENDIKVVYVFDGDPPEWKKGREEQLSDETKSFSKDAKELLTLMGIPYVIAKSEAEAECISMAKKNIVDCVATDDMDALPFGANFFLRNIMSPEKFEKIDSKKVLNLLELDYLKLVDFSILLGCSYCKTIKGIGQVRAYKLIKKYKNIEEILNKKDEEKFEVSDDWEESFRKARHSYLNPEIGDFSNLELKWNEPKSDELIKFLCVDHEFNEISVNNGIEKIMQFLSRKPTKQQKLDKYITITPRATSSTKKQGEQSNKPAKKTKRGGKNSRGK